MLHSLPNLDDASPIAAAGLTQSAGLEQAFCALGWSIARIDGQLFITRYVQPWALLAIAENLLIFLPPFFQAHHRRVLHMC